MFSLDKIRLYRSLANSLRSGISIGQALTHFSAADDNELYASMARDVNQGTTLADAMRRRPAVFPAWHTEIVAVGENTGRVDQTLLSIASSLERTRKAWMGLLPKLAYPLLLVIFAPFALHASVWVMDSPGAFFLKVFSNLAGIFGGGALVYYFGRDYLLRPENLRRFPIARSILRAQVADSLSILVAAGVQFRRGLELAARAGGLSIADEGLRRALALTEQGASALDVLTALSLFTPEELNCLESGEVSGNLDGELAHLSRVIRERNEAALNTLMSVLPVVVLLCVALAIAAKVIGFYGNLMSMRGF